MITKQQTLTLSPMCRGMHLITEQINKQIEDIISIGTAHLFLLHTSASLCLGENFDPTVRSDTETFLSDLIPESYSKFQHTYEGGDDMPAHLKSLIIGASLTIPVTNGKLHLGTWQGIYLYEHRDYASSRSLIVTLQGE